MRGASSCQSDPPLANATNAGFRRPLSSGGPPKVCLVIGAGAGIGGNVARRFAREGYHAVLCRRSDEVYKYIGLSYILLCSVIY